MSPPDCLSTVLIATGPHGGTAGREALALLGKLLGEAEPPSAFPHPRYSLSHTDRASAAAAALTATAGVGVDVEHLRPADPETARFFLRPEEEAWLRAAPLLQVEHVRLWTVKEALFKADLRNAGKMVHHYAIDDASAMTGTAHGPGGTRFAYTSIRRGDTFLSVAVALDPTAGAVMPKLTTVDTGALFTDRGFEVAEIVFKLREGSSYAAAR